MAAGALCAASPAAVQAAPDPCTGVGVVTCSGNQSEGVDNPPPGTTVLNVNSLTSTIAPAIGSGQPGILFFGSGNITLNSATGRFGIITSDDFVDGIIAQSDGGVKVTSSGNIAVKGLFANGINLLSFSGGAINLTSSSDISLAQGGNGLLAYSDGPVALTSSGGISVTGDGTGINATAGNLVTVSSSGPISITGDGDAIDAADIGGPSGAGGVTVNSSGAISLAGNAAIGINASSEDTDPVNVTSSSNISLLNGGAGISASGSGAITVNSSGAISVKGDAGAGIVAGSDGAGTVDVTSSGNISVAGDGLAIIAVSVGGAANVTSSGTLLLGGSGIGISAIGGTDASVISSGGISIGGDGNAISAISDTGTANVKSSGSVSLGGSGAAILAFSAGGDANVTSTGNMFVVGNGSTGIDAEGNLAGINSSGNISLANSGTAISASGANGATVNSLGGIAIGGSGDAIDASSAGGTANVTSTGSIFIGGNGTGISAQGDLAEVSSSGNISVANGTGISASGPNGATVNSSGIIAIGSNGSAIDASSTGGAATVTSAGNIFIGGNGTGIDAEGNLAQVNSSGTISLANGGTGISAAGGSGAGGAADVTSSGNIFIAGNGTVTGIDAEGNLVQVNSSGGISLANGGTGITASGGSGATVSASGAIAIGGNGDAIDAASAAGAATVTSSGTIFIGGTGTGIAAQGNLAQVNSSGNISLANGTGIAASGASAATVSASGAIAIGGNGTAIAASSQGGASNVTSSANLFIGGSGVGIAAQGSLVQVNSSGSISLANDGTGIAASGGNGATVSALGVIAIGGSGTGIAASSTGATNITSSGNTFIGGSGTGIAAQGNVVQVNSSGNIFLANGGTGIAASGGNQVVVNSSGNISVGGQAGSGIGAFATNKGGGVNINSSGDVTAAGPASNAILAQAAGGNINLNITRGTITGGSGTGAGIELIGGGNNTLANFGTITTSPGLAGNAILGMPSPGLTSTSPPVIGNNIVNNAGTVVGNVALGPGRNTFNNLPGGTLNSGAVLNLGAGNSLNNNGNLSPGGIGVFQTTALTGNLVQGSAGKYTVDVNPATGQTDRINASGSAQLAGQVVVNPIATAIPTVTTPFTILHADGGVTSQGLTLVGADLFSSAVVTPELELLDPNDLALLVAVDFAPPGLNGNQTSIGQNINAIQQAGSSPSFLPVAQALVTIPDLSGLEQAYNQLSPETYADNKIADFYSGLRFANSLMSCNVPDGRYAFIKEGQCVWAQIGGKFLDLNATSGSLGFAENAFVMSGGAEVMLRPDWFASFALGYDHGDINTGNTLAQSQANRAHFGAAIKYNPGPLLLAAAVYGGYGWYTTDRYIDFADFSANPTSDSNISRVGGQLRAAYLIDRGAWYLKPLVDLNVTRINLNGFSEQGAGGADLNVSGSGSTVFSASPAVEVGTQTGLQNGALVRPFARLGVSAYSNTNFAVTASFAGAPTGVVPFSVATGIDSVTADVAAGADLFLPDSRWALKLAYDAHYGARVRDQGVSLKATIRF
ncbi:MAG TPA: autotransporter domain-containing protein [Stellaceae bacterium]|nr:autotransporter domain-containing protein [Stellaceae bacterium]